MSAFGTWDACLQELEAARKLIDEANRVTPESLRWMRERMNMSQRKLAAQLHCTPGHISQLERGKTTSIPTLLAVYSMYKNAMKEGETQ